MTAAEAGAPGRFEENLGGAGVALSAGDLEETQVALDGITVQGHRYGEASQPMIDG